MLLAREVKSIAQRLEDIENGQQAQTKNQEYIIRTLNQVLKTLKVKKTQTKKPPAQRQHISACKWLLLHYDCLITLCFLKKSFSLFISLHALTLDLYCEGFEMKFI